MSPAPGALGRADPVSTASGRYLLLEHTADLRVRMYAKTARELYSTAVQALGAVLSEESPLPEPESVSRVRVSVVGVDPAELLICLLNEALYRLECTGELPVDFQATQLSEAALQGTLLLRSVPGPLARSLLAVKAATYHDLRWEVDAAGEVITEITLDL